MPKIGRSIGGLSQSGFGGRQSVGKSYGRIWSSNDNAPGAVSAPNPPSGTNWSTLGVRASNSATANSTALNSLPTGVTILADNPDGGTIFFNKWTLQSNLDVRGLPDAPCTIESLDSFTVNAGSINTPNVNSSSTNLTNVKLIGLNFRKGVNALGRMFFVAIDNFEFKYNTVDHHWGFMFIRGSNQEIAYNVVTNPAPADNSGMRHFGNGPKVPTTGGKAANVWVHNNYWQSHDGTFQIDQSAGVNDNLGDDFIFENNYAFAWTDVNEGGTCYLFAGGVNPTQNIIVRGVGSNGLSGAAGGQGIKLSNDAIPVGMVGGGIRDMTFQNMVFDGSYGNGTQVTVQSNVDHPGLSNE
jgi:hypothetical protein